MIQTEDEKDAELLPQSSSKYLLCGYILTLPDSEDESELKIQAGNRQQYAIPVSINFSRFSPCLYFSVVFHTWTRWSGPTPPSKSSCPRIVTA